MLRIGCEMVMVTELEHALLRRLHATPDEFVSKPDLLRDVWDIRSVVQTNRVAQLASQLRKKLGAHAWRLEGNRWGYRWRTE